MSLAIVCIPSVVIGCSVRFCLESVVKAVSRLWFIFQHRSLYHCVFLAHLAFSFMTTACVFLFIFLAIATLVTITILSIFHDAGGWSITNTPGIVILCAVTLVSVIVTVIGYVVMRFCNRCLARCCFRTKNRELYSYLGSELYARPRPVKDKRLHRWNWLNVPITFSFITFSFDLAVKSLWHFICLFNFTRALYNAASYKNHILNSFLSFYGVTHFWYSYRRSTHPPPPAPGVAVNNAFPMHIIRLFLLLLYAVLRLFLGFGALVLLFVLSVALPFAIPLVVVCVVILILVYIISCLACLIYDVCRGKLTEIPEMVKTHVTCRIARHPPPSEIYNVNTRLGLCPFVLLKDKGQENIRDRTAELAEFNVRDGDWVWINGRPHVGEAKETLKKSCEEQIYTPDNIVRDLRHFATGRWPVIFVVHAPPRFGKSVLARYIVQRISVRNGSVVPLLVTAKALVKACGDRTITRLALAEAVVNSSHEIGKARPLDVDSIVSPMTIIIEHITALIIDNAHEVDRDTLNRIIFDLNDDNTKIGDNLIAIYIMSRGRMEELGLADEDDVAPGGAMIPKVFRYRMCYFRKHVYQWYDDLYNGYHFKARFIIDKDHQDLLREAREPDPSPYWSLNHVVLHPIVTHLIKTDENTDALLYDMRHPHPVMLSSDPGFGFTRGLLTHLMKQAYSAYTIPLATAEDVLSAIGCMAAIAKFLNPNSVQNQLSWSSCRDLMTKTAVYMRLNTQTSAHLGEWRLRLPGHGMQTIARDDFAAMNEGDFLKLVNQLADMFQVTNPTHRTPIGIKFVVPNMKKMLAAYHDFQCYLLRWVDSEAVSGPMLEPAAQFSNFMAHYLSVFKEHAVFSEKYFTSMWPNRARRFELIHRACWRPYLVAGLYHQIALQTLIHMPLGEPDTVFMLSVRGACGDVIHELAGNLGNDGTDEEKRQRFRRILVAHAIRFSIRDDGTFDRNFVESPEAIWNLANNAPYSAAREVNHLPTPWSDPTPQQQIASGIYKVLRLLDECSVRYRIRR